MLKSLKPICSSQFPKLMIMYQRYQYFLDDDSILTMYICDDDGILVDTSVYACHSFAGYGHAPNVSRLS